MKILWVGKYASDQIFRDMAEKGYKDPAAQVSQSNLIHALDQLGVRMDTINAYNVPVDYTDKYIQAQAWSRTGLSTDVSVGYTNIKYISHLFITNQLVHYGERWAKENIHEHDLVIVVYGMQSSLMSAAVEVKKAIPHAKFFLIVPDLPDFMDFAMTPVKKMLKKVDWLNIKMKLKSVDGFILYTRHMANYLNLPDGKWIEMEGAIDRNDIINIKKFNNEEMSNKVTVMYSGKIDMRFGIIEYLEAIRTIKDANYEFWFTGAGNALEYVKEQAVQDRRIKYLGFFPSRRDLLRKQAEATMLINTRLPSERGSSYCFPSKLFEYMASARPVLTFNIDGIPTEYFQYLVVMKSPSSKDIANSILHVGRMNEYERASLGESARKFVLENKNSLKQAERMLKFFKGALH